MSPSLVCSVFAAAPMFGNQWLALLAIALGIALFMAAVAVTGKWLAATHPADAPRPHASQNSQGTGGASTSAAAAAIVPETPSPQTLAIIAAVVRVTFGANARVAEVLQTRPAAPSVEMLMQQWSMEGRRQIYSSHQIR